MFGFVLNSLGNVSNAMVQVLLFAWIAHSCALVQAGVFALSWALVHVVFSLFGMQVRSLITTDVAGRFALQDFKLAVLWGNMLAAGVCLGLGLCLNALHGAGLCLLFLILGKCFENMSDFVHGCLQRFAQIRWVGLSLLLKNGLLALALTLEWGSGDLGLEGLAGIWALSRLLILFVELRLLAESRSRAFPEQGEGSLKLMVLAWPMALLVGVLALSQALPRFSLEKWVGLEAVGIYASLMSTLMVGVTLTNSVGQFLLMPLARCHSLGLRADFAKISLRFVGSIVAVGFCLALFWPYVGGALQLLVGGKWGDLSFQRWMVLAIGLQCAVFALGFVLSAQQRFKLLASFHLGFLFLGALVQICILPGGGLESMARILAMCSGGQLVCMVLWLGPWAYWLGALGRGFRVNYEWVQKF